MKRYTELSKVGTIGQIRNMRLVCQDNIVSRVWGQKDGKSQRTSNKYKGVNIGKANELTPVQVAQADYDRIVEARLKEGYTITVSNTHKNKEDDLALSKKIQEGHEVTLPFIPTSMCASKPVSKITPKNEIMLDELMACGEAEAFVKYNGICHYILKNDVGKIVIYTRRLDDHTLKYHSIVAEVEQLNLPNNTLWITEFHVEAHDSHILNFKRMSEISKVDTLKGQVKPNIKACLKKQVKTPIRVCVLACLYHDGFSVWKNKTWEETYMKLVVPSIFTRRAMAGEAIHLHTMRTLSTHSVEETKRKVRSLGDEIEGAVIWVLSKNMMITFDGKPKRRAGYKVILNNLIDVVAVGWNNGTGDRQGKIGSLNICDYDKNGELYDCGSVGSGIKDSEADPVDWTFPCVIEIKFTNRFPSGKFQFPRFMKSHENKLPEEIRLCAIK